MRAASLTVPAQTILLLENEQEDGRWLGEISINGQDFAVEAYATNSKIHNPLLADDQSFAETEIDGRPSLLVVMPKGGP